MRFSRYIEPVSGLGSRIMKFRNTHKLTQADLALRYDVSGPAIFKFEKGFVTPSLKLWLRIAADIGIPEKEAVLLWVKEKLPQRMHHLISEKSSFEIEPVRQELEKTAAESDGDRKLRDAIIENPEISPGLKRFVSNSELWGLMKPTPRELAFLIDFDRNVPLATNEQFRDVLIVARAVAFPED